MRKLDADSFAQLVDSGSVLSDELRDRDSAELISLVSVLREFDFEIGPSEMTLERQRQRLVAMAAVRTPELSEPAVPGRHRAQPGVAPEPRGGLRAAFVARLPQAGVGRRLVAGFAGLSVIVATLGILALIAQSAIPGDTLYALKRGTEQVRLALAGGEQAQGRVLLGFASTRLLELDQLLDEPVAMQATGSGVHAADADSMAGLLIATMDTMDLQTTQGSRALTSAAVDAGSLPMLQFVGKWSIDQFGSLDALVDRMPDRARIRATESKNLLQRVVNRLEELAQGIGCQRTDEPPTDDIGPLPSPSCSQSYPDGSPTAAGPGSGGSASTIPQSSAPGPAASNPDPSQTSNAPTEGPSAAPGPSGQPSQPTTSPAPLPDPNPLPTRSNPPTYNPPPYSPPTYSPPTYSPSPTPPPPGAEPGPAEGDPCVLIGFLGIRIPGIIIGGVCIGLGG